MTTLPGTIHRVSDAPSLYTKHQQIADNAALGWRLPGSELEDVKQEARVALWEAARSYDPGLGVPFHAFAKIVIHHHLSDRLRIATRGKHRLLTEAARDLEDAPTSQEEMLERRAELRSLVTAFQQLSLLEQDAIRASATGTPYTEIGSFKQVDNAVQRGRRKLRSALAA